MINRAGLFLLSVAAVVFLSSCAPTYPRERLVEGVKELCRKEYGVEVDVKVVGRTLGVRIPLQGIFDPETKEPRKEALDKIFGVMLSVSRVALSSDRSIDFYTITTTDKDLPGFEIIMTIYVNDMIRVRLGDLSLGEFIKRRIYKERFSPEAMVESLFGEFTVKDIQMPDFICEQASRRIIDEFQENKALIGKFQISYCEGKLDNGTFTFIVDIKREGLPMSELIHGTGWHDEVLDLCLQKIAKVIHIYGFSDFDKVSVYNKFDNKSRKIDRSEIGHWRTRRVTVE